MIIFVVRQGHAYTVEEVPRAIGIEVRVMAYRTLLTLAELPRATYIFTDHDRIPPHSLRRAAAVWRRLRDDGMRVLNDPARMLSRYGLLRRLHAAGFNSFNAYRVEDGVMPAQWPAFLRCEGDHVGPVSGLIHGPDEMRRAIDGAVAGGIPLASLLIIEYAAEEIRPGLFRKYGCFRIAGTGFADLCVDHSDWVAKIGRLDVTPADLLDDEFRILCEDPHGAALAPAFDIAGIDYGRADFGFVAGRPQVYEINTNPEIAFECEHPQGLRRRSYGQFREHYLAALQAIDMPAG